MELGSLETSERQTVEKTTTRDHLRLPSSFLNDSSDSSAFSRPKLTYSDFISTLTPQGLNKHKRKTPVSFFSTSPLLNSSCSPSCSTGAFVLTADLEYTFLEPKSIISIHHKVSPEQHLTKRQTKRKHNEGQPRSHSPTRSRRNRRHESSQSKGSTTVTVNRFSILSTTSLVFLSNLSHSSVNSSRMTSFSSSSDTRIVT